MSAQHRTTAHRVPSHRPHLDPRRAARRPLALLTAAGLLAVLTACGGGGEQGDTGTLTEIDYDLAPPQSKMLPKMLDACGSKAGMTIKRQAVPRDQLVPKLLRGASQRQLPDLALIDNPDLQQIAATGALAPLADAGFSTKGFYPSIVSAGRYQNKTYGIAPGVNGLALFYDKDMFDKAGVKPPSTWDELKKAAGKLTHGSTKGLGFSAVGNEEGTWTFEPFLWSNGGSLTKLNSPQVTRALTLWSDLVDQGSVSKSVVNWSQADVADQFVAGHLAMMVNGSWQLPVLDKKKDLDYGVVPLPVPHRGAASRTPLGGEVWAVARNGGQRQKNAVKVLNCMMSDANTLKWAKANAYVPSKRSAAARLARDEPGMKPFVDAVATAKSRTAKLGVKYPKVSTALSDAIQAVLAGSTEPRQALDRAQKSAPGS